MKKHLVLLASVFVALGVTLGLAACGPNEEELIREQVAAELGRVSDASEENVRGLLGDETFTSLQDQGLDPVAIYSALFGKFTYEITDVSIEDDVAQVSLTVTNVDIASAVAGYEASVTEWAGSDDAVYTFDQEGQEGIEREVTRMLYETLTNPDLATKTGDVTIELRRGEDGVWVPANEAQVTLALFAGADVSGLL